MSSGGPQQNALPHRVRVEKRPGLGKCIVARESVEADQIVLACPCDKGTILSAPSMHSLQVRSRARFGAARGVRTMWGPARRLANGL